MRYIGWRREAELEAGELKMLSFVLAVTEMDTIRNVCIRWTAQGQSETCQTELVWMCRACVLGEEHARWSCQARGKERGQRDVAREEMQVAGKTKVEAEDGRRS